MSPSSTLVRVLMVVLRLVECITIEPQEAPAQTEALEFPFVVQLQRFLVVSYLHQCGGSLLTPLWIVTAAHCNLHRPKLQALAGTVRRNDRTGGQRRPVVRFVAHEQYTLDGSVGPYDIALALVQEPFVLDGVSVATIALSGSMLPTVKNGDDDDGNHNRTHLVVMGFGKIDQHDTMPEQMKTAVVHARPARECSKKEPPMGTFCVGSPSAIVCQGDSGGPVVSRNADDRPLLIGVVSFGSRKCGTKPITCTDVAAYGQWINGTLTNLWVEGVEGIDRR